MSDLVEDVLGFWCGKLDEHGLASAESRACWYKKDPAFDDEIRERFGELHAHLNRGEHVEWRDNPRSATAAIIVLDQFSRNMFRGTADMFASDTLALEIAKSSIGREHDTAVAASLQSFVYMPLMHSENLDDQNKCIELFDGAANRAAESNPAAKEGFRLSHGYAIKHRDIVERFGRFPHRNETLGRDSTPAEIEFLKGPGSSF